MEHARPAQLIVVPRAGAGWQRGHTAAAALGLVPELAAGRAADHVRSGRLDVTVARPDARPSRTQASPPPTAGGGTHYHYFRSGPSYGH